MRLFQNSGLYPAYLPRLDRLAHEARTFRERLAVFLGDGYAACHILDPVVRSDADAFFTNADDERLQTMWAREHGMRANTDRETTLLAQIEAHRTEVFYNLDPMRFGNAFLARLPGCVRHTIAWRAAPSTGGDFNHHQVVVNNFPGILAAYRAAGMRAEFLCPGHDPAMDAFAANADRRVDVVFIGGYSRHHRKRAEVLERVAQDLSGHRVVYHLDRSRMTRLAESFVGPVLGLAAHRRPRCIRDASVDPVFGRELYGALSGAKIVINGAVDMAGADRGNMRCFEALGCGALMVSDRGVYPEGMVEGETMLGYDSADEATSVIASALADPARLAGVAGRGHALVRDRYSKRHQWEQFTAIAGAL
jgi:hypothetical protein